MALQPSHVLKLASFLPLLLVLFLTFQFCAFSLGTILGPLSDETGMPSRPPTCAINLCVVPEYACRVLNIGIQSPADIVASAQVTQLR